MPTSLPYRLAVRVAHGLLPLVARPGSKMATGHRGRTLANQPLERWAAESRDASRPLVWMHAPSVGEGLQVAPVLDRLVRREQKQAHGRRMLGVEREVVGALFRAVAQAERIGGSPDRLPAVPLAGGAWRGGCIHPHAPSAPAPRHAQRHLQ